MIFFIKKSSYFLFLSLIICFADQLTKYFILINNNAWVNKNFILFTLDFVKNYGAAFNIFSGNRILLCSISIVFSIILLYLIFKKNFNNIFKEFSYSFILGGTLGNGLDRILNGYVVDFINLNFINFSVFNIADIAINIGLILILYSFFKTKANSWRNSSLFILSIH